ncbi:Predicted protein [Taphrina deformans PYCC 5710]|uniref:Uncharacterized protein n=1 Tax=Taphrina deformans (strain PYCC 5710 / ATCC 11124 / CBS 356.35 / IMI 108563 / JCM 9778 / NBRC 8474) TaxID=1097556 RepID=R4X7R8_TAPDE|nr:Predicted protein [Taphrina deformans PYCC 5710]|eukprot:CCG81470.1 Predicted protein [Taphrina deformans PYCC 5710]
MDPAAVEELQRLYARKTAQAEDRPKKKRRISNPNVQDTSVPIVMENHANDVSIDSSDIDDSYDDTFDGFSNELSLPNSNDSKIDVVEVVTFDGSAANPVGDSSTAGYKSFMSGKVPKTGGVASLVQKSRRSTEDDDSGSESDAADDLKKDKELQRLLRESHLLQAQGNGSLETEGRIRHKATAAQLIANGASKPKQRKMPIGMRKGIEAAANKREGAADKYNRDNGIVTARKAAPVVQKRSNKTLHELNLGKYKNGKLSISRKEIDRVNGPRGGSAKGKKKRGFRDFSNIG